MVRRNGVIRQILRKTLRTITSTPSTRNIAHRLTRSGYVPRSVWKRLPIGHGYQHDFGNGHTIHFMSDDAIGRALYWRGVDLTDEGRELRVFCSLVKESRRFLDVGANTGIYSLLACAFNPDCQVDSFEPVPRLFEKLQANVKANSWEHRCRLHQCAVSDQPGTALFHVPLVDTPTSASLNVNGFRGYDGEKIQVTVSTLDDLCFDDGPIDLMKIDVEGFEDAVLRGMPRIIERDHPSMLIECLPDGPYKEVEEILNDAGYHFFHVTDEALNPASKIIPDKSERFKNYLCTVREEIMQSAKAA